MEETITVYSLSLFSYSVAAVEIIQVADSAAVMTAVQLSG